MECKTDISLPVRTKSKKVFRNGKWKQQCYKLSYDYKEMEEQYKQQLKLTVASLNNYKGELKRLKDFESIVVEQLAEKEINIEDPNFDVKKVFTVKSKRLSKAHRNPIDIWSNRLRTHKTKANLDYQLIGKKETNVHDVDNLFESESIEEISIKQELDLIFEREQQRHNEHDIEVNTPYIPQSIAQVFF